MADFIRREDALFALRKAERGGSMTALTRLERAYAEIREMPAADVAEVVRCKDCKHRTEWGNCGHPRHHGIFPSAYPYDFCSYGEQREEP